MKSKELKAWLQKNFGYKGPVDGQVHIKAGKFKLVMWFDPPANRMRIHTPICDAADVNLSEVLKANFHSTQDVHYAIHKGKLFAVYTHWLDELTKFEIEKAFYEVVNLAQNTLLGEYYSGDMILVPAYREAEQERATKQSVKKLWNIVKKDTNPKKKGKLFEEFVKLFLGLDQGLGIAKPNIKTKSEEIDLLIRNKILSPHWVMYNSPFIMVECKNWSEKIEAKHIRDFISKIRNHEGYSTMGLYFSVNGFTSGCRDELVGLRNSPMKLALIDGNMIDKFLNSDFELREFLEESLSKSIR